MENDCPASTTTPTEAMIRTITRWAKINGLIGTPLRLQGRKKHDLDSQVRWLHSVCIVGLCSVYGRNLCGMQDQ